MKIITIAARKGGVGKTTITYLISSYLAIKKNKRVLLIDGDPQANLTSCFFNEEQDDMLGSFLKSSKKSVFNYILKTETQGIDIIPTNVLLDTLNTELISKPAREYIFFNSVEPSYRELTEKYDYVFIDTNPSLSLVNQNLMIAANDVIIITDRSKFSVDGILSLSQSWRAITEAYKTPFNMNTIIINRINNQSTSKQFIELMKNHFGNQILETYLKEYAVIEKSVMARNPEADLKRLEALGNPISNIVNELENRGVL